VRVLRVRGEYIIVELFELSALGAAALIRDGRVTSEELVASCLERIEQLEPSVQAWAYLDRDYALQQARAADEAKRDGNPLGALHGVPVGVKDIFDTDDMPTEDGTVLHAGRRPTENARAVSLLREAGAIILGKTVTTEFAVYAPGKTRNPHDAERTPGGSSSGSAAAVAARMVPFAIGTQTNGSIIRPAAYCGVYGFKPTHGLIPRYGILRLSRQLDQVGVFAGSIEDAAVLAEQLIAYDEHDPDTRPRARPRLLETAHQEPPLPPELAFVKTPVWDQADAETHEAFAELVEHLGERVREIALPQSFAHAHTWLRTIMEADLARSFAREYDESKDKLSASLVEMIERGRTVLAIQYNHAVDQIRQLNELLEEVFDGYDAIVTPATTGVAPRGLESTGSPVFCTIWTLCGTPAITLPLLQGAGGMPMGVQLVGPRADDARLLRTARWLLQTVEEPKED
jgi:Asp-tRNA(Asn)/Glu-tRNA(Gln) amidotransferase A subunit family amidase